MSCVLQLPIRELAQGETRDLWLDMGPPKADKKLNPITGTVRVSRQLQISNVFEIK